MLVVVKETHANTAAPSCALKGRCRFTLRDLRSRTYVGNTVALCFAFAALMAYISASPFIYQNMMGPTPNRYGMALGLNALGLLGCSTLSSAWSSHDVAALAHGLVIQFGTHRGAHAGRRRSSHRMAAVPLWTAVASMGLIFGNSTALALGGATSRRHRFGPARFGANSPVGGLGFSRWLAGGETTGGARGHRPVGAGRHACAGHLTATLRKETHDPHQHRHRRHRPRAPLRQASSHTWAAARWATGDETTGSGHARHERLPRHP